MNTTSAQDGLNAAIEKLTSEVLEGLDHGFFDISVSCELVNGRKRKLTIKAGKSYRFTISQEDLRRGIR